MLEIASLGTAKAVPFHPLFRTVLLVIRFLNRSDGRHLLYRQRPTINVMSSACSPWLNRCTSATIASRISPAASR